MMFNPLMSEGHLNTPNTLRLVYKNQSVDTKQENNRLCSGNHTAKNTLRGNILCLLCEQSTG